MRVRIPHHGSACRCLRGGLAGRDVQVCAAVCGMWSAALHAATRTPRATPALCHNHHHHTHTHTHTHSPRSLPHNEFFSSSLRSDEYITSRYTYQTTSVEHRGGKTVAVPQSLKYELRTSRRVPRLGLMLVGWGGNNGSTTTAGKSPAHTHKRAHTCSPLMLIRHTHTDAKIHATHSDMPKYSQNTCHALRHAKIHVTRSESV